METSPENIVCFNQKIPGYPINGDKFTYPTAGAILLYHIRKNVRAENIYGFAFLDRNPSDAHHYYDNTCNLDIKDGVHFFEWEIVFLSGLFAENKEEK
jgi:hypothetical protein